MRFEAFRELLRHYWQISSTAWRIRKQMAPLPRNEEERAFLPAALELQDSPPHPAARMTLWVLMAFLLVSLFWACLGKIDIVAVAPGKLIVSDRSKVIQPLEPAIIKAIHVQDGQRVKAGQVLIELDSTLMSAEGDKNQSAWLDAKLEAQRAQALLNALDRHTLPELPADPELAQSGLSNKIKEADSSRMVLSQWQELQTRLATIDADTARKQAERAGTQEQVHKLEQTLPLIAQRANDYKDLADKNFVSKHGYLEKEQTRIETERDLATQRRKLEELGQSIHGNEKQKEASLAEFRRNQNDTLSKAQEKARELAQDVIKSRRKLTESRLLAPVDGIVQQLAVHTVGGVVTEAQALMVLVPQEESVEAEVMLENKDIGFVHAGQEAAIKIETFNYTKYGLIPGQVKNVSLDAIQDEKRGLIYATRVKLSRNTMDVEGKQVRLTPGMAVSVEIKTGQRRVIEYFLSPLIQYASEGLRER